MGLFQDVVNIATAPDKPELPPWTRIDPQAEQKKAIAGNTAALGDLSKLAAGVNEITRRESEKNLEAILPGYSKLRDKATANILDWESGNLPQDVQDLIARKASEGARASGTSGSEFANFKEARTLGLTSLDLMTRGTDAASKWIAAAASRTPTFDISRMFITPQQQIEVATNERNAQFSYTWAKNQWDATPSPKEKALNGLYGDLAGIGDTALSFYTGGVAPGGSGGGMGGSGGMESIFGNNTLFGGGSEASVNSKVNGMKPMSSW